MKSITRMSLLGFVSVFLISPSRASAEEEPEAVPHVFQAGEPASAAEMNENFQFLFDDALATKSAIDALLLRVTTLEENATKLFKGINLQNNYELVSSQTVLDGNVEEQGDYAILSTYVAKGTLNLNANNTWSLEIGQQEHELTGVGTFPQSSEIPSQLKLNAQTNPAVQLLSGTWSLSGNTLTLSNAEGVVVSFIKSIGGDMLISPNNEIRAEGDRRMAAAGSVVAVKVSESAVVLTAPADGASYTTSPAEPASITLSADVADPEGTVEKVEFLANGIVVGTDFDSPYSISWEDVPAGNYRLTARATAISGAIINSADEAAVDITVSAPAP